MAVLYNRCKVQYGQNIYYNCFREVSKIPCTNIEIYSMPNNSTSKIKAEKGLMSAPAPRSPYARL